MSKRKNEENLFTETLKWICENLYSENIPYMITGGSAVGFWGQVRTTMDIDVLVDINKKNFKKFLQKIKKVTYLEKESLEDIVIDKKMLNIIYNPTCFKVDLIPLIDDEYELSKFKRRIKIKYDEDFIFVISPEDLIISKLLWSKKSGGLEKQIKDCESVYKLNKESLNISYLKKWIDKLNLANEFKKIIK